MPDGPRRKCGLVLTGWFTAARSAEGCFLLRGSSGAGWRQQKEVKQKVFAESKRQRSEEQNVLNVNGPDIQMYR